MAQTVIFVDAAALIIVNIVVAAVLIGIIIAMRKIDQNVKSSIKKVDAVMAKLIGMGK